MTVTATPLENLDQMLQADYSFLRIADNPVVRGLSAGEISADKLKWILAQYCFLPIRIVEILGTMASAVYTWPRMHNELLDNIFQECGSKTREYAHIAILRETLQRDLGLDLTLANPCAATDECLDRLADTIRMQRKAKYFIAGMAYSLEASALPELMVVAELINRLCDMSGRPERKITNHTSTHYRAAKRLSADKHPQDYSIEDFLVIHLCYIEVEHRNELKKILQQDVRADGDFQLVQDGFRFVLDSMEIWWNELASHPARERDNACA
jgi:hypothetical protein